MNVIDVKTVNRILAANEDFVNATILDGVLENGIVKAGNNFCSEAARFTVHYEKEGEKCQKSFFLKIPYNVRYYDMLKHFNIFTKEIRMYDAVFPLIKLLLPNESLHPQFYGTDGKDALILEDLTQCGYQMHNRYHQLDFDHCAVALRMLAKFHAASIKIDETRPQILDDVLRNEAYLTTGFFALEEYCDLYRERLCKVIERADPTFAQQHREMLLYLKNTFLHAAIDALKVDAESLVNVLNHGDFWTNNIMFAYDSYGLVTNAKCIDLQLCRWASPAIDILYFTINSMRPEVFEKYFDLLLDIYTQTFNATLQYLECNQPALNVDDLRADIEKKYPYILQVMVSILPIVASNPDSNFENAFTENFLDEQHYIELSTFWIKFFIEKGVFSKYEDVAVAIDTFTRAFENKNGVSISKYELNKDIVKSGNNFTTGIVRLKFEYKKGEETITESVVLKVPSMSINCGDVETLGIYNREIYVYKHLLPELYDLWNGERFTPICYAATDANVLVLEDLAASGFGTIDKNIQLDLDHCQLALTTLAKYHAITMKYLRNNDGYPLHRMLSEPVTLTSTFQALLQSMYDSFLQAIQPLISKSIYEKLQKHRDAFDKMPFFQKCDDNGENFYVIGHCDFWLNNIMFAYDDDGYGNSGRVCRAMMIDWQLCRKTSPAMDLIYFFASSVQFEVFEANYDALLNTYLETLNSALLTLKCDYVYTHSQLNKAMDEHKSLYTHLLCSILRIVLSEIDKNTKFIEIPTIEKHSDAYLSAAVKWLNYLEDKNML